MSVAAILDVPMGTFEIRKVTSRDEILIAFDLQLNEPNWNAIFDKFEQVATVFPNAVFIVEDKESGLIVGVVCVYPTFPGQYCMGNLVVRKEVRNRSIGSAILKYFINKHRDDILTLSPFPGADMFYRQYGFQEIETRYFVEFLSIDRQKILKTSNAPEFNTKNIRISQFTPELFAELNAYDTEARGYDCIFFMKAYSKSANDLLVAMDTTTGDMVGYAVGYLVEDLLWIDGMMADTDAIAVALLREMVQLHPEKDSMRIHTVEGRTFLAQFGQPLPRRRMCLRMGTKPPTHSIVRPKLYAVMDCGHAD